MMKNLFSFFLLILVFNNTYSDVFIREYKYFTDISYDNRETARIIAIERIKGDLLNEVGLFLKIEEKRIQRETIEGYYDEFERNIETISAGITNMIILDEIWNQDSGYFYIKAKIEIDLTDFQKKLNLVVINKGLIDDLEESRRTIQYAFAEIERLKNENLRKQSILNEYNKQTKRIASEDFYQKAVQSKLSENFSDTRYYAQKSLDYNQENLRAKKLMSPEEYLSSDARQDYRISKGAKYIFTQPKFIYYTTLYSGIYGIGYVPTYLISSIWSTAKESNKVGIYVATGLTLFMLLVPSEDKDIEELSSSYDSDNSIKINNNYSIILLSNAIYGAMAGMALGGTIALLEKNYDNSNTDILEYFGTGIITGATCFVIQTLLFVDKVSIDNKISLRTNYSFSPTIVLYDKKPQFGFNMRINF